MPGKAEKWAFGVFAGLAAATMAALGAALAVCVYYMPGRMRARIAVDQAKARVLSELDLRDEKTRKAIRELIGGSEDKP